MANLTGWIIHKKELGENFEVQRLVDEFEKQGVDVRVVNPKDVDIFVDRDDRKSIMLMVNQKIMTLYFQEQVLEQLTLLKALSDIWND